MNNPNKKQKPTDILLSILIALLMFSLAFVIQFVVTGMYMVIRLIAIFAGAYMPGSSSEEMAAFIQKNIYTLMTQLPDFDVVMLLIFIVGSVAFGLLYYFVVCKAAPLRTLHSSITRVQPLTFVAVLICGVLIQIYLSIALNNILPFFEETMNNYMNLMNYLSGDNTVCAILSVAILAPVTEELLFRGLIQKQLSKVMPVTAAILIQAVLFGVYHLNIVQGLYAVVIGAISGFLVQRYKTVSIGILLHIAVNSSSYLISVLPIQVFYNPVISSIIFTFTFMTSSVVIAYMLGARIPGSGPKNSASTDLQPSHAEVQEHNN